MSAKITINDPKIDGVLLESLMPGDYFRFPASGKGAAYQVMEIGYDSHTRKPRGVSYTKIDNGHGYSSSYSEGKRVQKLRLVSAVFELEEGR